MPLLTLSNIHHAYGNDIVLDGATLSIERGEKVGMIGRNGCGKTTLMKVILGQLVPDSGSIQLMKRARAGYLSQDPEFNPQDTVRDVAESSFEELHRLHIEQNHLFEEMASASEDELKKLLRKQEKLEAAIQTAGGYAIDHRIDATLHGLGFKDEQFKLNVNVLSGGQKGRLGLSKLLLEAPDLLLLDEPTNHLDIDGREWLEDFLAEEYTGAVILISHDRWLLDKVVDRIIEIDKGVIREYPGNYHKYVELKRERLLTESRVYEKQLDRIRSEQQFIAKYKTGQRAKQARGRQSRLDRFKRDVLVERPMELDTLRLKLPKPQRSGDIVVKGEGLTKEYDDVTLFENIDIVINRGDRVGIIGPNGAGKTTLINCMLNQLEPTQGIATTGSHVNTGYYRQSHEHIDLDLNVWQYLQSVIVGVDGQAKASEQQARNLAGSFLFSGSDQDKLLGDLSGGERSRAVLAGLVGSAHNLLVLDEPTNHLDIPSSERLEQALSIENGYEGTLIIISHDRALLESTCNKLVVFEDEKPLKQFDGCYSQWLGWRRKNYKSKDNTAVNSKSVSVKSAKAKRIAAAEARADENNSVGVLARMSMSKLERRIEELENRIKDIDELLLDPDVYTNGVKCKSFTEERSVLSSELEPLEFEWSRRAEDD